VYRGDVYCKFSNKRLVSITHWSPLDTRKLGSDVVIHSRLRYMPTFFDDALLISLIMLPNFLVLKCSWHWASECPDVDVKNYKWLRNPDLHRMFRNCSHMATVGVKGLMPDTEASSVPIYNTSVGYSHESCCLDCGRANKASVTVVCWVFNRGTCVVWCPCSNKCRKYLLENLQYVCVMERMVLWLVCAIIVSAICVLVECFSNADDD